MHFNDLESAVSVFDSLQEPSTMVWNLIIKAHVESGHIPEAFSFYRKMRRTGVESDHFTFPIMNRAVLLIDEGVFLGEIVHCVALKSGFESDLYFANTMMEVFMKYSCLWDAHKLFDEISDRDLVSWTSIISGYVREGNIGGAFALFNRMRNEMEANSVTVIVLLRGCSPSGSLIEGIQLHGYVMKNGLLTDKSVQNSVLNMYAKLGYVEELETLFGEISDRDIVGWNTVITYYSISGNAKEVVCRFMKMRDDVELSVETLTLVISVLAKSGNLSQGRELHCHAMILGLYDDVLKTCLLDLYSKWGKQEYSIRLFRQISRRNTITWCVIMSSCLQNGCFKEAIEMFKNMQTAGVEPRSEILRGVVSACVYLGSLQVGKEMHGYFIRKCFDRYDEETIRLETSILNMYIRCGSISSARVLFDRMLAKDRVAWTSMIEGYATHGFGFLALELFHHMVEQGVTPNGVTFLSLLSACSHSGLVSEGCRVFYSMKMKFGIEPDLDHYTCLVDLFGRSGKLKKALALILKMPIIADGRIWGALLSACRLHGHREVGRYAAAKLSELETDNVGYYTISSNVQASCGQWDGVEEIRRWMNEKELKKSPGWSFIEARGLVHSFLSGDGSHARVEEIHEVVRCLNRKTQGYELMQTQGYELMELL